MQVNRKVSSKREETDRACHRAIAKATGNSSLELVVDGLWDQRAELWGRLQQHFHTESLTSDTLRDHDAIIQAIANHDADAARGAMHRHLGRVIKEFQRSVDDAPATATTVRAKVRSKRQAKGSTGNTA